MCLIPGLPEVGISCWLPQACFWGGRHVACGTGCRLLKSAALPRRRTKARTPRTWPAARLERTKLEIGFQLIPLVDEKQGGQMLNRVRALRRHLSSEMGFLVPPVHISDNLR